MTDEDYFKKYYQKNRERIIASSNLYYKNNLPKRKEWVEKNKDKLREYRRRYRIKHLSKLKEQYKKYQIKNREKLKVYARKYYKKKREKILNRKLSTKI
jgi:hypothetical protein